MLSGKKLMELKEGDVIEVGHIFEACTEEPLCFKLKGRSERGTHNNNNKRSILTFEVWYHSIPIGEWAVKVDLSTSKMKTTWMDVNAARGNRCH